MNIRSVFFGDISQTVEKMSHLATLKNPLKFLSPLLEAVDFRNLISSSFLSTDASLTKFSRSPDRYFYVKLHANTHRDRVTEQRRALQNLLGGGIN